MLLIGAASGLAACAARGPRFAGLEPPPPGRACLYLYRVQENVPRSMDLAPAVSVGGQIRGNLLLGGFIRVVVEPGQALVALAPAGHLWPNGAPLRELSIRAVAGEMRFVEFEVLSARSETIGRVVNTYLSVELREVPKQRAMFYLPHLNSAV